MRHPTPDPTAPGQESVWSYPRPPALRRVEMEVVVRAPDGHVLARSDHGLEVLETSHPPGVYLPRAAWDLNRLVADAQPRTVCEWKGAATYWHLRDGDGVVVARDVGWSYEHPTSAFAQLRGHLTVYPERVGEVTVDGEVVAGQPGEFYGGWVTSKVAGPFKGTPGSMWW